MNIRACLLHLRPRSWPIVFFHYAAGGILASGRDLFDAPGRWALGGTLWAIALNGGTLALNTAFDRDEGDIGYLDNPPPAPKSLAPFALALMTGGLLLSLLVSPGFFASFAACFALSIVYSAPPLRLKSRAGWDVAVNGIGYGFLTPLAGAFAAAGATPATAALCLSFGFLFASFYPATQIYQIEEDAGRGDRTLAMALGVRRSLDFALWMFAVALLLWISVAVGAGGRAMSFVLVAIAAAGWLLVLVPWRLNPATYPAKKGMYRALKVWALTDLCLAVAFMPGGP